MARDERTQRWPRPAAPHAASIRASGAGRFGSAAWWVATAGCLAALPAGSLPARTDAPPLLAGAAGPSGGRAPMQAPEDTMVEVWLELSLPALATLPRAARAEREQLLGQIEAQQDEVAAHLRALSAVEIGRVRLLRNAIAVRLPRDRIDMARQLPGVQDVRVVRDAQLHHKARP